MMKNITYIPMKQKDNLVTWFKDLEKLRERIMQRLPDGIDKNEYELTKWSTMIHQLIVTETSQTLEVPMKSKDNLVAWVKNHAKLPERIDKDEYELIKWSTMIHQVIVMETSQTYDDSRQLSKGIVHTQTDSD